jgi:hypothetical protein
MLTLARISFWMKKETKRISKEINSVPGAETVR